MTHQAVIESDAGVVVDMAVLTTAVYRSGNTFQLCIFVVIGAGCIIDRIVDNDHRSVNIGKEVFGVTISSNTLATTINIAIVLVAVLAGDTHTTASHVDRGLSCIGGINHLVWPTKVEGGIG